MEMDHLPHQNGPVVSVVSGRSMRAIVKGGLRPC